MPKQRKTYTADFKLEMLKLIRQGNSRKSICQQYHLSPSTLNNWINNIQDIESLRVMEMLNFEKSKVMDLQKENEKLLKEKEVLKQAVLILGRN